MKIFISWSGEASHDVAMALKTWIPNVLQAVETTDVFLSSSDVALGTQWFHELGRVLEESHFGVLCLTRQNLSAPWLLYEAGAISKRHDGTHVAPLLIGLTKGDVPAPLSHFQAAVLDRNGAEKLVALINNQLGEEKLSERKLADALQKWWHELETAVQKAVAKANIAVTASYTYDIFLSAPMASYSDEDTYVAARANVKKVFDALALGCGMRVYWAGEKIERMSDFDTIDVSVLDDLQALEQSCYFVLVYPERLASSAIFEAGYMLARGRPSHYFVRDRNDLPFLLRELPGSVPSVHVHTRDDWKDYDDLARKLKRHNQKWFGSAGRQ